MPLDVIDLALGLISKNSITGADDNGAIKFLVSHLEKMGFSCNVENFSGDGSYAVDNLYAQYGSSGKNLCFAGHTDVVPPGDESSWSVPPFSPRVVNGELIGRGAVDMKGAIAAWIAALSEFLEKNPAFDKGTLSLLITGDEETDSINGTVKLLRSITAKNISITSCVVGEPSNQSYLGDTIKVGRRGSINYILTVKGIQGHVAYPEKTLNPNTVLVNILHELINHEFDKGNQYFQPTNLEITSIDVNNPTGNLIPEKAAARFNIRFNSEHDLAGIKKIIDSICAKHSRDYQLEIRKGECESFLSTGGDLADIIISSCRQILGKTPDKGTGGGTSDARFIKDYAEVAEFGLVNTTAHKIDEKTTVKELRDLKDIYLKIIENYFA